MDIDFKKITYELIPVFDQAALESIELYKEGIEIAKLLDKELAKVDSDIEVLKEQLTNINLGEESE